MKYRLIHSFLIILFTLLGYQALACTSYLVSKGASKDGSVMITYAADSHIRYGELYWRPAMRWPAGSMITLYDRGTNKPLGQIPQVSYTYQVIGFMNEHQVAIGESTFDGRAELWDSTGMVDYGSLMFLAMQRSKSAREAIQVIASLVEQYGYASTGESFSIADANEVWIMELIGKGVDMKKDKKTKANYNANKGAVWVAIRIPDGYVSAHANHSRITKIPAANGSNVITSKEIFKLNNPEVETIYSVDIISFARSRGYFNGKDEDFSFSQAYAPMNFTAARFAELRVWSMFHMVNGQMAEYWNAANGKDSALRLPLYVKADRKLSPHDLISFKRDYLQNTELDMSKDAGAGPFGLPYRWRPLTWTYEGQEYLNERTTVTQQTGFSFVAQLRSWLPSHIGGIYWFGVDDVGSSVHVPFYAGITHVHNGFAEGNGDMLTYSDDAAFWIFNRVAHFKYLFYNRVQPEIEMLQGELEKKFAAYIPVIDAAALTLYKQDSILGREFLTDFSDNMASITLSHWTELSNFLLVKFLDGNVKQEKNGELLRNPYGYPMSPKFPGYPDSWKKQVVDDNGENLKIKGGH